MPDTKIKRALIAVYDKTGIAEFAKALVDEFGIEIISTGGTAKHLKDAGVPVTMVEEVTGFPEMLDGRVKTLHPKVHAGILADRDKPEHMRQLAEHGIKPIDMVVVNLYPFEDTIKKPGCTFEDAIEMIDIGGPCMLRAAAKNHKHVVVIANREDADFALKSLRESGEIRPPTRVRFASGVFETTRHYDEAIAHHLLLHFGPELLRHLDMTPEDMGDEPDLFFDIGDDNPLFYLARLRTLRYGENPHQRAHLYVAKPDEGDFVIDEASVPTSEQLGGKEMSFNNFVDTDAALELCKELARANAQLQSPSRATSAGIPRSCCVFIKHTNACGVAMHDDPLEAYRLAYVGDPNAAMGGILAMSCEVDAALAEAVMGSLQSWGKDAGAAAFFVEVWIARAFDDEALEIIRTRKKWGENVRLLAVGDMARKTSENEASLRHITRGILAQSRDLVGLNEDEWRVVTKRSPTELETADLRLAWLTCKHTKSNAITICKDGMLIGNGAGQMSRVMSCRIATWLAKENGHEARLAGSVAASDAFFPFRDGPDILADAGVTAIIQPGGSKRDEDTIHACNERGIAMIVTGTRHFKH